MQKWSADDPKAPLMERKRAAIVDAARESFLQSGYSDASMDGIADAAGVSVKAIYLDSVMPVSWMHVLS